MFAHVGKGLPTYRVTRAGGRQPFAANHLKHKQSNQLTLKMLDLMIVHGLYTPKIHD